MRKRKWRGRRKEILEGSEKREMGEGEGRERKGGREQGGRDWRRERGMKRRDKTREGKEGR